MVDPQRRNYVQHEDGIEWDDSFPWQIRVAGTLIRSVEQPRWWAIWNEVGHIYGWDIKLTVDTIPIRWDHIKNRGIYEVRRTGPLEDSEDEIMSSPDTGVAEHPSKPTETGMIVGIDAERVTRPRDEARVILKRHHAGPIIRNGAYWNGDTILRGDCFLLLKGWRWGVWRVLTLSGLTIGEQLVQSANRGTRALARFTPEIRHDTVVELWDEENFRLVFTDAEFREIAEQYSDFPITRNEEVWNGKTRRRLALCTS
jgi:hypothetical protein